jgi:hypothetical protein
VPWNLSSTTLELDGNDQAALVGQPFDDTAQLLGVRLLKLR